MGGYFFNSKVMEKDMKMAAQAAIDLIEQTLPPMDYEEVTENAGRIHALNEYGHEIFQKGVDWVLEMLWQDASEIPDTCEELLIRDDHGKIRRCKKHSDYVEDLDDGLPLLNDEICEFISIETLGKTLAEGLYDKAKRFTKGG